jgi:hypothetical protein
MRRISLLLGVGLAAGIVALVPACATPRPGESEDGAWVQPALRRLASAKPDSVVTVFLRFEGELSDRRRRQLRRSGLQVEVVLDSIIDGRLRAGDIPRVARLPWIAYIREARTIRISPPPLRWDAASSDPPR